MFKIALRALKSRHICALLAALLTLIVIEIIATNSIPLFRKTFYSAMEAKSLNNIKYALWLFVAINGFLTISQSLKSYISSIISLGFRTELTKALTRHWAPHKTLENTAQRINEDCKLATELALKIAVEMIISASIVVSLAIESYRDTKLMAIAIVYTAAVSIFAKLFKRPLIDTEISLQREEANHRHALSWTIVKSAPMAPTLRAYKEVTKKYLKNIKVLLGYSIFSSTQNNFSILAPWLVLLPTYLISGITFGEFMAKTSQFELIVLNSTILITLYPQLTKAQASWIRIKEFLN